MAVTICICCNLYAQDTLRLTLPEAEKKFINNNLALLAQKYNIDIARAQVIQARLYNNPNITFQTDLYNPGVNKFFDVGRGGLGEYAISAQQLIILAGKRNKQIKLAQSGVMLAEQQFYDLLRTLRYSLRSDFYNVYYLQNSLGSYQTQITALEKLNTAYHDLQTKGIVSLKDAVRIQSLLYSLKAENASLQNQINDVEAEMQLLLQDNKTYVIPIVEKDARSISPRLFALTDLTDTSYANRFDLKQAETSLQINQQNYSLQKAMAVPDLLAGAGFDKNGSYTHNFSFVNMAIDLPFFNRNQGNIKAAKASIDQGKVTVQQMRLTVENEVQAAYTKALNTDKTLQSLEPDFPKRLETLLQGVTENFQKKNISLLDFTDFYDSYKQNILQINQLQNDKMQAIEALNFSVGKTVINP